MAMVLVSSVLGAHRSSNGDDEADERLDQHDELVGRELTGHGSTITAEIDDGLIGVFPVEEKTNVVRIVACALRIVQELEELGMPVRIGLDAGELATTRKGVRGEAIDTATEVMRNAAPGEVLVSGAARDLVTRTGQRFTDLGEFELEGVEEAVHLFRAEPLRGPHYGPRWAG
jgi:class 3 adenylate cyclase